MSKEIMVGGRLVEVPTGYVQAESEFTKNELDTFYALDDGPAKEEARTAVMEKRLDFYYLWLAGEADLPTQTKPKEETLWATMARYMGFR